jgi:hypothetical protein
MDDDLFARSLQPASLTFPELRAKFDGNPHPTVAAR